MARMFGMVLGVMWRGCASCALGIGCVVASLLGLVVAPLPAFAQTTTLTNPRQAQNDNQPMLLQADEMIYDNRNNTVIARGNVEIYWNNYTLLANQVTYDQNLNTLAAEGNVRIKEPGGAIIQADQITLTDDFREGFLRSLKIVTEDDSRIAAASATRQEGDVTVFERGVYTPCKPCENNPDAPPTWRIKAYRVIHKQAEGTIEYQDAVFEFLGMPVAWVPYFKHADPSVKRKSGFLIPVLRHSGELGFSVETPYYFALAPNYDFTFSPRFTQEQGVLWQGQWRHRTANGRYEVEMAGIFEEDPVLDDDFRGSIKTRGHFDINQWWSWGWDVTADTDDAFRRYYELDSIYRTDRVSQGYLEGIKDRNYFGAHIYNFGGLLSTDSDVADYWVHPVIDYNYIFSNPIFGGELSFNSNAMSLTRDDGADSSRIITEMRWRRSVIDGLGQVYTPFASVRGDTYHVSNFNDPNDPAITYDSDTIFRGTAVGGVEYRYPFVAHGASSDHIIEPIAQLIARPSVANNDWGSGSDKCGSGHIPNEDACSLVFDDTLLFDIDKSSGYDRLETGSRANVGIRYTMQQHNGGYLQAIFGQSIHLGGENDFAAGTGLDTTRSDYVTGVYYEPSPYLAFIGQARLDEDSFALKRTDVSTRATVGPVAGAVSYATVGAQPELNLEPREEVYGNGSLLLTQYWSVFGETRFDIEESRTLTNGIGVRYADDCFAVSVSYQELNIHDPEKGIVPDERLMFRFELKNLGAFNFSADPRVQAESGSQ